MVDNIVDLAARRAALLKQADRVGGENGDQLRRSLDATYEDWSELVGADMARRMIRLLFIDWVSDKRKG
jgi:hypothetical protein